MAKDKIVVLRNFAHPIEANIAKTKLDAHGIPCFLSDENFSNLIPANYIINNGVRLHVFERDRERAIEILSEIDG